MKFKDNAKMPIIAIDFDGTICVDNTYPNIGKPRRYAKEVINFLFDIGVNVVIWTSRDLGLNQDGFTVHDDLTPMIKWLGSNEIKYSSINKSIQFAPFHYQGRKIYAHMYVDDLAYGFQDTEYVMVDVLRSFLCDSIGMCINDVHLVCAKIMKGVEFTDDNIEYYRSIVSKWRK